MKLRTMIAAVLEPLVRLRSVVGSTAFVEAPALGKWFALRSADDSVTLDWGHTKCTTKASVQVRRGPASSFSAWDTSAKIGNLYFLYRRHVPASVKYSSNWRAETLKPLKRISAGMPS